MKLALDYLADEPHRAAQAAVWRYGWGQWERAAGRLTDYRDLTHFGGTHWQSGPQYPDPQMSYLGLHAAGGHPGIAQAVVRRWTAPRAGTVAIEGTIEHPDANGDGVEAIILSSRHGVLGQWTCQHGRQDTNVERVVVEPGDTIDFVVDRRANDQYDAFLWAPKLRLVTATQPAAEKTWNAQSDFHGPDRPPLDVWIRLAQVLLLSNEFVFLD